MIQAASGNANGLIRQYLPERSSFKPLAQPRCNLIADHLNRRPRKRLDFPSPLEAYETLRE